MDTKDNKLEELNKLEKYLKDNNIRYMRYDCTGHEADNGDVFGERHQIRIYEGDSEKEQSIICHPFSYGYEEGLLEGMGSLFSDGKYDDVIGWMTANDVIERIENKVRYNPYKEMNSEIRDSINNLRTDVESIFSGIKAQIDYTIKEIQKDNISIEEVKELLKQLSDDLDV